MERAASETLGEGEMHALEMAELSTTAANSTISLSQKLDKMIAGGLQDYNSWKLLILEIEKAPPEDINTVSLAYDSFLSKFPLCHWHWNKYAYQKALCNSQEAVNIYERAVEVAMFSAGFWADYFTFAAACFESPVDIRRLFERAISFVGRDYFSHVLWDKYMKYEFNQEGWNFLAQSYIWALRFPTKKLHFYYDNFKQFVANLEVEIGYESYDKNDSIIQPSSVPCVSKELSKDEISLVINDMLDSSNGPVKFKALDIYRSVGVKFYLEAQQMEEKIKRFETKIQRHYFDVTALDDDQLNNWHLYLDFIEKQDNLDWTMKLYERCLIPCANYPEFWMRYVDFLESRGGRELAISALTRATQIFVKSAPEIHLFDARFKEHIGDANGARAALALCYPKTGSGFIERIDALANLERRLGNLGAASATYEKALKRARAKQELHILPSLYSHCAHLRFLITGNAASSRDVLIEGIRQVPNCRFLLEELIKFAMTHEGANHVNIIDSTIGDAISPGLDEKEGLDANDRENVSCLFLEFVNLCGTTHDIRKAWNRHIKLFPRSLRMKTVSMHPASGYHPKDLTLDEKGNSVDQHHRQEQAPELRANNEIQPNQVVKELVLKDQSNIIEENVQVLPTKDVLSNGDESRNCEPAHEISDGEGTRIASVESSDQGKEASTVRDFDQASRGDERGPMDIIAESGMQSKDNALEAPKSAHEVGKSTESTESIELERELIPMSRGENETMKIVQGAPKITHSSESFQVRNESEKDRSVSYQHNAPTDMHMDPREPSSAREDLIEIDNTVQAAGHATSRFQDRAQDKSQHSPYADNHPANALGRRQQYPARRRSESRAVQEDKATDQNQQLGVSTPPTSINTSGEQLPVSYAQQNMNPMASATTQQQWLAQQYQNMLPYHYQQQQFLQQQYQQQLHMQQHPYYQMQQQYMNQQPYQVDPKQQNHQQQLLQGHNPLSNFQQVSDQQYQQSQDIAHQHQLAYQQHASQEQQQLLWQQYQQYQYQLLQQQQQLKEGSTSMQQDELLQKHHHQAHSQQKSAQNINQNQQGSTRATPDYDAARHSESPHPGVHSPRALQ